LADESNIYDFLIAGDDQEDFAPTASVVTRRSIVLVGSTSATDPGFFDRAIVAFDAKSHEELWRATWGELGERESFTAVAADAGRVCAVGIGELIGIGIGVGVSCYKEESGEILWERSFALETLPILWSTPRIELSGRTLLVMVYDARGHLAMAFDSKDGS
jgi:outer membrane protein assembly factor BamB